MYVRMYICNMYMYVCVLLHWPTSVTIQSLKTLRHNGYLSLGQPAKPQPSLVPAIINITWSHRTIHYLHVCLPLSSRFTLCWNRVTQGHKVISRPVQQLDKKSHPPVRRLRYDTLIPRLSSSGGRESLGMRLWRLDRAAYGGCTLIPSLYSDIIQVI